MKKIILFIVACIALTNFCFSQANQKENERIKPNSRIGGVLGMPIVKDQNYNTGLGASIFFHQTISRSWFVSIEAGYNWIVATNRITANNAEMKGGMGIMPFTLGANMFLSQSGIIHPYLGFEAGILNQKENASGYIEGQKVIALTDNNTWFIIVPTVGIFVPVAERIGLAINIKFQLSTENSNIFNTVTNVGFSYLIP
jgi:hypothetical protein